MSFELVKVENLDDDNINKEKIIEEFIDCILAPDNDTPDISVLPEKDKEFCLKHYNEFNEIEDIVFSKIQLLVQKKCNQYCIDMLSNNNEPYLFCDATFQKKYENCFNEYCITINANLKIPKVLSMVIDIILLQQAEYERSFLQLDSKLRQYEISYNTNKATFASLYAYVDRTKTDAESLRHDNETLKKKIRKINNNAFLLSKNINKEKESLENATQKFDEKINNSERKSTETCMAVLGVFSAIVLAFNGALTLSSAAVEGLSKVSPYRLVLFILLLGFVLINVLFALFYFVNAIIIRNRISSNSQDKQLNKNYIIITDVVILVLVGITICAWYFDIVGCRDNYIKEKYSVSESADTDDTDDKEGKDKNKTTTQPSDNSEPITVKILGDAELEAETTTKKTH